MKNIEIDEALYQYIASNTQFIGESASAILRRLLAFSDTQSSGAPANVPELIETADVVEKVSLSDANDLNETQADAKRVAKKAGSMKVEASHAQQTTEKPVETAAKKATVKSSQANVTEIKHEHENETVFNFINKEELAMQRGAVGRFLLILAALYRAHPQRFKVVNDISGRDRLYFADSEEELDASGSSTKPRQIPDSPFWVITNSNTTRKKMMLTKAASLLGYTEADAEKIRELL